MFFITNDHGDPVDDAGLSKSHTDSPPSLTDAIAPLSTVADLERINLACFRFR